MNVAEHLIQLAECGEGIHFGSCVYFNAGKVEDVSLYWRVQFYWDNGICGIVEHVPWIGY